MRRHLSARVSVITAVLTIPLIQGCASLGGPGVRTCAPYLLGGAAIGAGLAATSSDRDTRVRNGAAGAAVGAAAGYGVCVAVWRQKQELETRFAALEGRAKGSTGSKPDGGGAQYAPVVRSIEVLDNRALRLELDLTFATGQSRIQPRVADHLNVLAGSLTEHPQSKVLVVGHTDNVGDPDRNRVLSYQRATAVAEFLAQQGVASTRFEIRGMGSDQPLGDNSTEAGRHRNRRVEVVIVPI